jgi:hypothetical protein
MAIFAPSFLPQLAPGKSAAPTARRGRRDDKGKGCGAMESGGWSQALFITLGGPQAHDHSGQDDKFVERLAAVPRTTERSVVEGSAVSLPTPTNTQEKRRGTRKPGTPEDLQKSRCV